MRTVIYAANVSLDGYIEDPDGGIGFTAPDEDVHRAWNEQARSASAFLFGRRTYELMEGYWPTAARQEALSEVAAEFARLRDDAADRVLGQLEGVADGSGSSAAAARWRTCGASRTATAGTSTSAAPA